MAALRRVEQGTVYLALDIRDCSRRNHIVLDAFLGSGTTLIATEKIGRIA
jgi:DNA modification methylase